jgi:hypothetical protein
MIPPTPITSTWCLLQEEYLSQLLKPIFIRWIDVVDNIHNNSATLLDLAVVYHDIINTLQQIMALYNTDIDLCVNVITNQEEQIRCLNSLTKGLKTLTKVYDSIQNEYIKIRRRCLLQTNQNSISLPETVPTNTVNPPQNANSIFDCIRGVYQRVLRWFQDPDPSDNYLD